MVVDFSNASTSSPMAPCAKGGSLIVGQVSPPSSSRGILFVNKLTTTIVNTLMANRIFAVRKGIKISLLLRLKQRLTPNMLRLLGSIGRIRVSYGWFMVSKGSQLTLVHLSDPRNRCAETCLYCPCSLCSGGMEDTSLHPLLKMGPPFFVIMAKAITFVLRYCDTLDKGPRIELITTNALPTELPGGYCWAHLMCSP